MRIAELRLRTVFIVVLATALFWAALFYIRLPIIKQCVVAESMSDSDCTPFQILSHDPYCIIDPVCVSPFYRASADEMVPRWQGTVTNLLDPSLGGHGGYQAFALVNFALFTLLTVGVAYLLKIGQGKHFRWLAFGLCVWVFLEWTRWAFVTWMMTGDFTNENLLSLPATYVGVVATAAPLVTVVWIILSRQIRRRP
jgi:hypothetical protein